MRLTPFGMLLVILLIPGISLAQPAEPGADDTEQAPAEGDAAEGDAAEGDAAEGDAAEGDAAEGEQVEGEQVEQVEAEPEPEPEPEPQVDPEPELSAVPQIPQESGEGLGQVEEGHVQESALDEEEELDLSDEDEGTDWHVALGWDQEMTAYTLAPGSRLPMYNPTYLWSWAIVPSYDIPNTDIRVDARQTFDIELTQNDSRTYDNEVWFYDTRLRAIYTGIPEVVGISITPAARVFLPVSKSSRAAERRLGLGMQAGVSYGLDVLEGLEFGGAFTYDHWFAASNVPSDGFGQQTCVSNRPQCRGGATTTRDQITAGLSAELAPIENLGISTTFTWIWNVKHSLDAVTVMTDTGVVELDSSQYNPVNTWFTLGASYQFTDYVGAELTLSTLSPEFDTDGSRNNPFFSEFSSLVLSASLSIDALYSELSSTEDHSDVAESEELEETAAADRGAAQW